MLADDEAVEEFVGGTVYQAFLSATNYHRWHSPVAGTIVRAFSCVILPSVEPGHHVAKGEELGYFQFGGSTHCLVFGPGVIADFALNAIPQPHDPDAPLVPVSSRLATVSPKVPPA